MTRENSRNINHPAIRIRNRYRLRKRSQPFSQLYGTSGWSVPPDPGCGLLLLVRSLGCRWIRETNERSSFVDLRNFCRKHRRVSLSNCCIPELLFLKFGYLSELLRVPERFLNCWIAKFCSFKSLSVNFEIVENPSTDFPRVSRFSEKRKASNLSS